MTEMQHVLAYSDPEHACNQGSLIALRNGELLLGYNQERGRVHADSGQSCLIKSRDGGRTWDGSTRRTVWPWSEHIGNWDCAFSQRSNGEILMHTRVCSFMAPTALKGGADQILGGPPPGRRERLKRQTGYALCRSTDDGATWSAPIPVNTSPIADSGLGPYIVGGSGAGHIIELPDGGLLMPLHGTFTREWFAQGGESPRVFLLRSDDGGNNWEYWATVAYDPAHILEWAEAGMARLSSGRLVCLLRTQARPARFDNMWFVYSDDDGRVLAVYGDRRAPWGVRACISDDGMTWPLAHEFVIREGGAADPSFRQYWHIGYPTVAQLGDGTVVAAYHQYSEGARPIQHMWVTRFRM
jgi:sialidase-1